MNRIKLADGERLFTELRTVVFRKEQFDYIHVGIMGKNGESWTTTELDEVNMSQVYNQYRVRHGIPFPDEICALRKYYGLSALKMSEILGFGVNQYRYYENGEMPSASNARMLIAVRDKRTFLSFLEASIQTIGEKDYAKIHKRVAGLPQYECPENQPSVLSGYVSYSPAKIAAAVKYFIRDRTVSRRSEPSSRATLIGEQPNPWDRIQPQDVTSRHRGAKPPRRCGRLGEISLLSPG